MAEGYDALHETQLLPDSIQQPVQAKVSLARDHDRLAVALACHAVKRLHRDGVDFVVDCQSRDILAGTEQYVDELVDSDLVSVDVTWRSLTSSRTITSQLWTVCQNRAFRSALLYALL